MTSLPGGTVCFLMTDIEGSTRLAASLGDAFARLLDEHFELLDAAVVANGGKVVSSEGDALFAVFTAARQAIAAAIEAQRALSAHSWPADVALRVRMGIHAGEAVFGGRDYTGLEVHRTARIAAAAWGGEILASQAINALAAAALPEGTSLRDLGEHSLRDLPAPERLFQVCAAGLALDFPPPRSLPVATRSNLPAPLTRFVGRRRELADVALLLAGNRLVTLAGPGGTGKTRLAIEVARSLLDDYRDGVWFVALDSVTDPSLVLPTIAATVGLTEQPGRSTADSLAEQLAGRRVLLVLDNLEQVVAAAPDIARLLTATTELRVLGSSRELLGLAGEHVYQVPTLGLPSEPGRPTAADLAGAESVELFVERARTARPGFALTDDNAPAIAAICRRLDGLPLALELAAARINLLAPAQILERLDHRLALVASSRRDLPERQRTLRGAIDWSYELLSAPEQAAFRRFSVFAGGADLAAVLAVIDPAAELAADPLDLLSALVERSLVRSEQDATEARFGMLETIREYAAERLAQSDQRTAISEAHAHHFADLADRTRNVLTDANRKAILDQLDREMPNLRAALEWLIVSGDIEQGRRMAVALKDFWRTRGHLAEGRRVMATLLERSEGAAATPELAQFLGAAAELANWQGDYVRGQALSERHIAMLEELGDTVAAGKAWTSIGWANVVGNPELARAAFERSIEVTRRTDDEAWLMAGLQGLALSLLHLGRLADAHAAALEAIEVGERAGDAATNALNFMTVGAIEGRLGDRAKAADRFVEGLRRSVAATASMGMAVALDGLATLAIEQGNVLDGVRIAAHAQRLRNDMGGAPSMEMVGQEAPLVMAQRTLAPADYERAVADGSTMTTEAAAELAFRLGDSARAAFTGG